MDVCGLCCCPKPCTSPGSVFSITIKDMEATLKVVSMPVYIKLRKMDIEPSASAPNSILSLSEPPKATAQKGGHQTEFLKIVIEMLKYSSPQLMASSGVRVGKDSVFFFFYWVGH